MRTRNGRTTAGLAATCAAALLLAACGGGDGETASADGPVEGAVAYSFWGTPERATKVDEVISLFESANAGATVDPEVADYLAYVERLTVRAAGGDMACVTGMQSTFMSRYAENGALRPLDDLIESGQIDTTNIPDDVLAAGQIDGEQFMLPTGTFVRLLAYNERMVAEAGVEPPTDDMTWEQYADWLRDLQAGLPEGVHAVENEGGLMFTFTSWVVGHGEQMFDEEGGLGFSEDLLRDYFQYWLTLTEEGVALPASSIPEQSAALELTPIAQGRAATGTRDIPHLFIMEQTLTANGYETAVPAVSMPSEDPDTSANVLGSNGLAIPADCDNVATAAAFVDFFANDVDAALVFRSDNGILTNTEAQVALVDDGETPEGVKRNVTTLQGLQETGDLTTSSYPAGLPTLTTELLRLYEAVAFGDMTVDAAVDAFFASADGALD